MEDSHEAERGFVELGRAVGDEGSDAVTDLEDTHGGEVVDAGAKAGAADFEGGGELSLGRDLVAGLEGSVLHEGTDVVDHLHGAVGIGYVLFYPRHGLGTFIE